MSARSHAACVTALEREARCLRGAEGARWRVAGIGRANALAAARALLAEGARGLVSFGVAGGLDPSLRAGALLLPERVRSSAGDELACDAAWRERVGARLGALFARRGGTLLEARAPLADPLAKRAAFEATGALAADMESAAVALAAAEAGVPFLCLRAVCDGAALCVPRAALRALDGRGRLRPVALLASLAAHPGESIELLALRRAFRAATDSLAQAARRAGTELSDAPSSLSE